MDTEMDRSIDTVTSADEGINLLGEDLLHSSRQEEGADNDVEFQRVPDISVPEDSLSPIGGSENSGYQTTDSLVVSDSASEAVRSFQPPVAQKKNKYDSYGSTQGTGSMSYSDSYQKLLSSNTDSADSMPETSVESKKVRKVPCILIAAMVVFTIILLFVAMGLDGLLPLQNTTNNDVSDGVYQTDAKDVKVNYFPFPNGTKFSYDGDGFGSAAMESSEYVPYPTVNRADYSVPATDIVFPELFHPSLKHVPHGKVKGPEPYFKSAFPTGAFWTNLVVRPTADRGYSDSIMAYPYGYKWNPSKLAVSYPSLRRNVQYNAIIDTFNSDLTLGTSEDIVRRNVVSWDPLSVTLRFYAKDDGESKSHIEQEDNGQPDSETPYWESYLVQGQPYITSRYNKVTPEIVPIANFENFVCPRDSDGNYKDDASDTSFRADDAHYGVCTPVNQASDTNDVSLKGIQFLIKTSDNITWMLFASEPITLTLDSNGYRKIFSKDKFSGVLRFAIVPPPLDDDGRVQKNTGTPLASSLGVKRLIYHSHTYPVGAKVSWDFKDVKSSTVGSVKFEFKTKQNGGLDDEKSTQATKQVPLLMLALPHHAQVLPSNTILADFDLTFQCIKGDMTPILGSTWKYDEYLTKTTGFDDDVITERLQSLDSKTKGFLLHHVERDLTLQLPNLNAGVYWYGKSVARLANLGHMASILESNHIDADSKTTSTPLSDKATQLLYDSMANFFENENDERLVYDMNFGGIVTKHGIENHEANFGNGWYNDHHFHYGYIMYACAFLARQRPDFVEKYGIHVDSLMYDVAHSGHIDSHTTGGAYFPFTRHKSWFDSHSFASGLFPFSDGKSQESSSEAVNCYYGAYLWSSVRWGNVDDGDERVNFARLLLATEVRGARTYWHMLSPKDADSSDSVHAKEIYPESFTKDLMVGNVGMTDVSVTTWFGNKMLYVHMINFMPVTEITRELFPQDYVEKEFNDILRPTYDDIESVWKGYVVADRAIIEPNEAWKDAIKLKSNELDGALSLSQLLYWISTQEGFSGIAPSDYDEHAFCEMNKGCADLGLHGECCPTANGIKLGCCD